MSTIFVISRCTRFCLCLWRNIYPLSHILEITRALNRWELTVNIRYPVVKFYLLYIFRLEEEPCSLTKCSCNINSLFIVISVSHFRRGSLNNCVVILYFHYFRPLWVMSRCARIRVGRHVVIGRVTFGIRYCGHIYAAFVV